MLMRVLLLWRTLLGHYQRHPAQGLFLLLGLSMGVAMLLATLIISSAARSAFTQAEQTLAGQAVAYILPRNGQDSLPEQLYRQLRFKGVSHMMPVVEGRIKTENGYLSLRGIDVFPLMNKSANTRGEETDHFKKHLLPLNVASGSTEVDKALLYFSFPPYLAVVSESFARLHNLKEGEQINIEGNKKLPPMRILEDTEGLGYFILCDIRCTQSYLNLSQRLTSIVFNQLSAKQKEIIEEALGEQAELVLADKNIRNPAFSQAFLLNLKAIGFLAFLVGSFIAFNAVCFSVLQRTLMVKQLRLCGATANEIAVAIMLELISWALLASVCGSVLAWGIASFLLPGIGITLNQLFFNDNLLMLTAVHQWWWQALLVALFATLIATCASLTRLARQQPLAVKNETSYEVYSALVGLFLIVLACFLAWGPSLFSKTQWLGLLISACWFIGGGLIVPGILAAFFYFVCQIKSLLRYPLIHWLFNDGRLEQQRQGVAMAAFVIAISASIAVVIMVSSFRQAFSDYLDVSLPESIYLYINQDKFAEVESFLTEADNVDYSYRFYMGAARINTREGLVRGMTAAPKRQQSLLFERHQYATLAELWDSFHQRKGVIINQALALSHDIQPGDSLSLMVNGKEFQSRVLGIYFSYGSLSHAFIMDQQWLTDLWPQLVTSRLGVFVKKEGDVQEVITALVNRFNLKSENYLLPQSVKQLALSIFRQTFYATQMLSVVILLIAAVGIFCACYISQLDKKFELTVVRLLGVSGRQMTTLALLQLFINTFIACLVAIPLGLFVAWASVNIVLRYSFGWYFDLVINTFDITGIVLLSAAVVTIGGFLPLSMSAKRSNIQCLTEAQ